MTELCERIISRKSNMRKIEKLLNLLINYTEELYKINYLLKVNLIRYVIILLSTLMKQKMNPFNKHDHKNKIKSF